MFKNLLFLFFIFIVFSFVAKAQETSSDIEALRNEIFTAYGFCIGQELSLNKISIEFPQLNLQVLQAKAEFGATFGQSCKNIETNLQKIFGSKLNDFTKTLEDKLNEETRKMKLTEVDALNFITIVRNRAKGDILSPYKETLLCFHPDFETNPAP